ncbi:MAG: orotidine-5'-phosphate decarboxylase [Deltaproteobacteria bacterium]|nr:orotidine-5'-phosphate decarboxylase [Deltaproteobacteria bacterium]MBM4317329.1 orotidine-5'-phosphate decarboxylase [Deltaproteobacteria bacterium]
MNPLKNVIVALDYENRDEAFGLVDTLGDKISTYKIGPVLFTRSGPEIIQYLHKKKKQIFVDLKLHDTPQVVFATIRQLAEMGVDFATVHCLGGKKMLEAASRGCRNSKLNLLGITLLTSFDPKEAAYWDWETTSQKSVSQLAILAQEMRLKGIVCSVCEAKLLRPLLYPGFLLITPGIRPQLKQVFEEDQERIASPQEAIEAGADYLIIGRPITLSRDPRQATENIFAESYS